ncbi:hypothetical protein FZEAL_8652 [Fusarium zealandicum]|uniref:Uncharacterized protein n=1 Tax=Fusarium zealandicum TaxID=1053134 RepID=A0A8H4UDE4_9HYPO|nr:hypothetical protein FZEAL_8652 [Fusarium zealandicum]
MRPSSELPNKWSRSLDAAQLNQTMENQTRAEASEAMREGKGRILCRTEAVLTQSIGILAPIYNVCGVDCEPAAESRRTV